MIRARIAKAVVCAAAVAIAAVGVAAPASANDPSTDPSPFSTLGCDCPKPVKKSPHPPLDQIRQGLQDGR